MNEPKLYSQSEVDVILAKNIEKLYIENEVLKKKLRDNMQFSELLGAANSDFQILTENLKDTIWLMDMNFRTIWVNPAHILQKGYTLEELRDTPINERLTPSSFQKVQFLISKIATPENFSNPNIQVGVEEEFEFFAKDGSTYWLDTSIKLLRNAQGNPIGFIGIGREITEKKQYEQALKLSEEKFAKAFMASPIGVIITRMDNGVYVDVNETFLKVMEFDRDEIVGHASSKLNLWADIDNFNQFLSNFKRDGFVKNFEAIYFSKNRKRIFTQISSEIIVIDNQKCILTISEDISERKEAVEELKIAKLKAEESDHLKSSFLANMSHEIRTPMNAILGFSQMLEKPNITKEKHDLFIKTIQQRSADLLGIINDIIDISKIETGNLKIYEEEGWVNKTLEEIKGFYKTRNDTIIKKPITFVVVNKLIEIENLVVLDFSRLKQVLINLVENAFKFTNKGCIELGCELNEENQLIFYVKDTGIGINPNKLEIIFDRFRQAEELINTRKYGGTGLGLSISKGIVELMNGKIWVESEESKGTTFYFSIPLKSNSFKSKVKEVPSILNIDWQSKTILLVEDVDYNALIIEEFLIDTKAKLYIAENGKEALQLIHEHPEIDLLLLDIRLPDINGFDLLAQIKTQRSKLTVIALTAFAQENDRQRCMEAGCDNYLSKPVSESDFLEMLSLYLK